MCVVSAVLADVTVTINIVVVWAETAGVGIARGDGGIGNGITTAGCDEGTVVIIIVVLIIRGRPAVAVGNIISCDSAGVSTKATAAAAAVVSIIAGVSIGPGTAPIGVIRSAIVDVKEAVGTACVDSDAIAVVRGREKKLSMLSLVIANVTNVVNCGDVGSVAGSVFMSMAVTAFSW